MTEQGVARAALATLEGEVLEVDYDLDVITVRLDGGGGERSLPFELFDSHGVYQPGQHFMLTLDEGGLPAEVSSTEAAASVKTTVSGYLESIDADDELVWVYLLGEEGWRRKVMPLRLFEQNGLAHPGRHFLIELDEDGTPLSLQDDEQELELQPLPVEEAKPRWTNRPAAEAEPESD